MRRPRTIRAWAVLVWLALWQLGAMAIDQQIILVSPLRVLSRLWELIPTPDFWGSIAYSLVRITAGFLLGVAAGTVLAALSARFRRVEELLAGGIPAACAVPGQPMKQSAPAKREPSAPRAEPVPAERPPLEEERPPLPDEPGERVDVDETPEPSAAPEDRLVAGEAPTGGEAGRSAAADLWPGLVAAVRGKFPAVYPFLSTPAMVQGRLEDGVLTLWVKDEFTKSMVGGASILEELGRLASAQTGVPARCAVKVGKAPAAPAAAAPAQAAEHDKLDDLLAFSRQFDNIIIQE